MAMVDCVWMRGRGGRCAEQNKSGYPSGRQPSCREWEDLEYGVLALPETFGGWIWGGGCIDCVSRLALLARETQEKTNFDDVNSEFSTVSQKIRPSLL